MWRCRKVHTVVKQNKTYKCKDVKLSIRHNSWLIDSKLKLEIILEFMYLWSQAFSIKEIMHELRLTNKTVIEWSTFLRECCVSTIIDASEAIGGNGVEVEIDESKFGKRKYHRGHRVEGQWVFGGQEKYDKSKLFMIPVANRKVATLEKLIKKWIKPGSTIHSDCWKAYSKLSQIGYTHVTVNHSKEFMNLEQQHIQMQLKVSGVTQNCQCLDMECTKDYMQDIWQSSCGGGNTTTVTNYFN